MALRTLNDWDFDKQHVQDITSGSDFLSSESVVICSGPPNLDDSAFTPDDLVPIGVVQNAQVTQSKQIQQFYEVGSRKPFFIPGRTFVNATIARVLFDGASLMKAVYIRNSGGTPDVPELDGLQDSENENLPGLPSGGSGNFYINLSARFFNNPIGLAFILNDMEDGRYGGFYLENALIQQHTFNIASQQTVLFENVAIRCTRLIPIDWSEA